MHLCVLTEIFMILQILESFLMLWRMYLEQRMSTAVLHPITLFVLRNLVSVIADKLLFSKSNIHSIDFEFLDKLRSSI